MRLRHAAILLLAGTLAAAPAFADEISDQIERALTAYRNHNTERALTALDAASHALREERASRLAQLLPIAPPGWTADPPETSAVSAAMLGGGTLAGLDIPPYMIATSGKRDAKLRGLNLIGLKRRGFSDEAVTNLKKAYKTLFFADLKLPDAIARIRQEIPGCPEVDYLLAFIERSERGICRG